jgi:hypothetical protein
MCIKLVKSALDRGKTALPLELRGIVNLVNWWNANRQNIVPSIDIGACRTHV